MGSGCGCGVAESSSVVATEGAIFEDIGGC